MMSLKVFAIICAVLCVSCWGATHGFHRQKRNILQNLLGNALASLVSDTSLASTTAASENSPSVVSQSPIENVLILLNSTKSYHQLNTTDAATSTLSPTTTADPGKRGSGLNINAVLDNLVSGLPKTSSGAAGNVRTTTEIYQFSTSVKAPTKTDSSGNVGFDIATFLKSLLNSGSHSDVSAPSTTASSITSTQKPSSRSSKTDSPQGSPLLEGFIDNITLETSTTKPATATRKKTEYLRTDLKNTTKIQLLLNKTNTNSHTYTQTTDSPVMQDNAFSNIFQKLFGTLTTDRTLENKSTILTSPSYTQTTANTVLGGNDFSNIFQKLFYTPNAASPLQNNTTNIISPSYTQTTVNTVLEGNDFNRIFQKLFDTPFASRSLENKTTFTTPTGHTPTTEHPVTEGNGLNDINTTISTSTSYIPTTVNTVLEGNDFNSIFQKLFDTPFASRPLENKTTFTTPTGHTPTSEHPVTEGNGLNDINTTLSTSTSYIPTTVNTVLEGNGFQNLFQKLFGTPNVSRPLENRTFTTLTSSTQTTVNPLTEDNSLHNILDKLFGKTNDSRPLGIKTNDSRPLGIKTTTIVPPVYKQTTANTATEGNNFNNILEKLFGNSPAREPSNNKITITVPSAYTQTTTSSVLEGSGFNSILRQLFNNTSARSVGRISTTTISTTQTSVNPVLEGNGLNDFYKRLLGNDTDSRPAATKLTTQETLATTIKTTGAVATRTTSNPLLKGSDIRNILNKVVQGTGEGVSSVHPLTTAPKPTSGTPTVTFSSYQPSDKTDGVVHISSTASSSAVDSSVGSKAITTLPTAKQRSTTTVTKPIRSSPTTKSEGVKQLERTTAGFDPGVVGNILGLIFNNVSKSPKPTPTEQQPSTIKTSKVTDTEFREIFIDSTLGKLITATAMTVKNSTVYSTRSVTSLPIITTSSSTTSINPPSTQALPPPSSTLAPSTTSVPTSPITTGGRSETVSATQQSTSANVGRRTQKNVSGGVTMGRSPIAILLVMELLLVLL